MREDTKPLRISEAPMTQEVAELLSIAPEVREKYGARAGTGAGPNMYAQMAHNPALLRLFKPLSSFFGMQGLLPARDREIAILRIAWINRQPFIWGEHVRLGHSQGGLSTEEVERITVGSCAAGWSEHDRAILAAVEELRETSDISEATWAVLARTWSEGQLVELPVLIGQYQTLGYLQTVLRFELWEGNPGLSAR
jgi:alkylhydroperoxidase family enzyme